LKRLKEVCREHRELFKVLKAEGTSQIQHDAALEAKAGCFSIALTYPLAFAEKLSAFSQKIADRVPALVYQPRDIHATVGTYGSKSPFHYNATHAYETRLLEDLGSALGDVLSARKWNLPLTYRAYLRNVFMVMAVATPNTEWLRFTNAITKRLRLYRVELRPTSFTHITVARFTGNMPASKLGMLQKLLVRERPPRGAIAPQAVAVGYSLWQHETWGRFMPHQIFPF
jgi:hypothetical protein